MKQRHRAEHGLSFVELLVVIVLLLFITAALLMSFLVGRSSFFSSDASTLVQQESRKAFDNVTRELREAGQVSTTCPAGCPNVGATVDAAVQLNFQIARGYNQAGCINAVCWGSENALGEWIHYAIVGASGNSRQLIRCITPSPNPSGAVTVYDGASCRVLANHVRHPNSQNADPNKRDAFMYNAGTRTATMNLEVEYQNPMMPGNTRTTGVLSSTVTLRNPGP